MELSPVGECAFLSEIVFVILNWTRALTGSSSGFTNYSVLDFSHCLSSR